MSVLTLTVENFDKEVNNSESGVLIEFWASWCSACKSMAPTLDKLADSVTNTKIAKVNVEENPELAKKFGVKGIPKLVYIKEGKEVSSSVGTKSEAEIRKMIGE